MQARSKGGRLSDRVLFVYSSLFCLFPSDCSFLFLLLLLLLFGFSRFFLRFLVVFVVVVAAAVVFVVSH